MSRVFIEEFRGFETHLDTESGKFFVEGDDSSTFAKNYNQAKTHIKDFVKNNTVFPEFTLLKNPKTYWGKDVIKVIGVNGHGRFVYEDKEGRKQQLSSYDLSKYIFAEDLEESGYDPDMVKGLEDEIKELQEKIQQEKDKLASFGAEAKLYKILEEFKDLYS